MSKKKSKKMIGVTCQCEEPAVARPPSNLRRVSCTVCGKIFQTDGDKDLCFECERKK